MYRVMMLLLALLSSSAVAQEMVKTRLCPGQSVKALVPPTYKVEEFTFAPNVIGEVKVETKVLVFAKSGDQAELAGILVQDSCTANAPEEIAEVKPANVCTAVELGGEEVYDLRPFEARGYYAGLLALGSCDNFVGQNMANYMYAVNGGTLRTDTEPNGKKSAQVFAAWNSKPSAKFESTTPSLTNNSQQLNSGLSEKDAQIKTAKVQIAQLENQLAQANAKHEEALKAANDRTAEFKQRYDEKAAEVQVLKSNIGIPSNEVELGSLKKRIAELEKERDKALSRVKAAEAHLPAKSGSSGSAPLRADQAKLLAELENLNFWQRPKLVRRTVKSPEAEHADMLIIQEYRQAGGNRFVSPQEVCNGVLDFNVQDKVKGFCLEINKTISITELEGISFNWWLLLPMIPIPLLAFLIIRISRKKPRVVRETVSVAVLQQPVQATALLKSTPRASKAPPQGSSVIDLMGFGTGPGYRGRTKK